MTDNEINLRCADIWAQSRDHEAIIEFLRSVGTSKFDTIKIIRMICGTPLGEAKKIVHASRTWLDSIDATSEFHDMLEKSFSDTLDLPPQDGSLM